MTIGENIRRIRSKAGLTQEEFGKIAGVSGMAVSQWENGRAVPRMGAVERIASSLRIPKASIIDENNCLDFAFTASSPPAETRFTNAASVGNLAHNMAFGIRLG